MSVPHPLVAKPSAAAGAGAIKPTVRSLAPAAEHQRVQRLKHDSGIYKRSSRVCVKKACDICKQSKAKCSGETPTCFRCQKLKHQCTYNAVDQRDHRKDMKGQLQRQKVENIQYKEILNHIKTASLPDLRKTMRVLRTPTGTSIEELLMFIRNDGKSILSKQDIRPTPATTDLTLLGNSQVETTDQTVPEQIMSHLVSSYIAWDAVAWNWFDVDIFLEGMVQKDFTYCTPLLVNCILALACHLSPRIPVRSDPHNPNSFGHRFIEEAIHLWHVECNQPNLTTIISGMLLCEVIIDVFTLLNKKKPPMDVPTIKLPENRYGDENADNGSQKKRDPILSLWRPYPYTQPAEPCRLEESVRMCSDGYIEWKRDIPRGLNLGDTVAPFVITPHLGYFQLILELSNAPLDPADTESEELATFREEVKAVCQSAAVKRGVPERGSERCDEKETGQSVFGGR
ncbi:hypothetical protein EYR41_002216 [Orbilia oligospora]|uniref:Zn(2)-C6 fungal-type domain-containing protein n=1 Tax=Orbilia oligospora TaxID=2813651 RepID=A0A8H2ECX4_ORBOL|nr:hypothetical protein EYR41_002216 [Orbilia oligospora]